MFEGTSILLFFGLLIVVGTLAGEAARRIKLPALTGQILLGILVGESGFKFITHETQGALKPVSVFALSLVAVTIGGHLEFRRLHNALRRIAFISLGQTFITFFFVFLVFQILNPFGLEGNLVVPVHLLVASIATSTSPATPVHIIKEKRAKGLLVKTTLGVVAMNNLLTLAIFDILHAVSSNILSGSMDFSTIILPSGGGIILSSLIGTAIGYFLVIYCRKLGPCCGGKEDPPHYERTIYRAKMFTAFLVALAVTTGLCGYLTELFDKKDLNLHPSPILANMVLGLVLANMSTFKEELLGLFDVLETAMFTCFFVLAGTHFDVSTIGGAWIPALIYFVACVVGKWFGAWTGARLNRSTAKIANLIGNMLLVQASIAIALVVILEQDPLLFKVSDTITTSLLGAVVATELIGGPLISIALDKGKETLKDRTRLIEFLQEEYILPKMRAKNKEEAIEELCWFLCTTHNIDIPPSELFESVMKREAEIPTGIGLGVAVPHARIKTGDKIMGVLGKLEEPIDYGATDEQPVWLIILVATPLGKDHMHLEVLGGIAKLISNYRIRDAIFAARSAEEIHEIIYSEEAETANYFLE